MVATDISEQRQLTELLSYQASHDTLTELYNRREFERHVQRALHADRAGRAGLRAAVHRPGPVQADQRHLRPPGRRPVAEPAGAGDGRTVARRRHARAAGRRRVRHARPRRQAAKARRRWPSACARASRATSTSGSSARYTISASIGVVMLDHAGTTLREVLSQADTACYMAKDRGRNRVHFYSEQDDETIAPPRRNGVGQPPALGDRGGPPAAGLPGSAAAAARRRPAARPTVRTSNCCCACATRTGAWCCPARSCRRPSATA